MAIDLVVRFGDRCLDSNRIFLLMVLVEKKLRIDLNLKSGVAKIA